MKIFFTVIFAFCLILQLSAQSTTDWTFWYGSHYSGYDNDFYTSKVAEFDRGVDGFYQELGFNVHYYKNQNGVYLKGYYYDPERMNLNLDAYLGNNLKAGLSYKSFYRQLQTDYLANMAAAENFTNPDGTHKPGGKQLTHDVFGEDEKLGYRRQEVETNLEFKIPGMENVKLFAAHRSIMEKGTEQYTYTTHCSQCHVTASPIDLERNTHTASGGLEVDLDFATVSYELSYRTFKSEAGPYSAFYDTIRHPRDPSASYYKVFQGRQLYGAEYVDVAGYPETNKISHKATAKANIGKGRLLLQFVNMTTENKDLMNESFNVNGALEKSISYTGELKVSGNTFKLNYTTPLFNQVKMIASGKYSRFDNDPIGVNAAPFLGKSDSGFISIDQDFTRYSVLTRTDMNGSVKFLYQPSRAYRLSLLGGFGTRERDDYPYEGAKDKTTKMRVELGVQYKPVSSFTGKFSYGLESIDNPFTPYNLMFESQGRGTLTAVTNGADKAKHIYYWQRDQLRYGEITMLPKMLHKINLDLNYKPSQALSLNAGVNASLGSNDNAPQLDFAQKMIQPKLGLTAMPDENFMFYGNYSYIMRSQNGLATVALMDG